MQITIDVNEEVLREQARQAFRDQFYPPTYHTGKGSGGYELIKTLVLDAVRTADIVPVIKSEIDKSINYLVKEILESEMRKRVREAVKAVQNETKRQGELLK